MQSSNKHRYAGLAALVFAVIVVSAVSIALLYWQYQLHRPLTRQMGSGRPLYLPGSEYKAQQ